MSAFPTVSPVRAGRTISLTLSRHFTTRGVSPYDGITWVRRSAKITERGGRVVFQMDDVEVPDFWSQRAVDIAVSKYFRKAGVPRTGHEVSIRQLIDRIAQTLAGEGVKQGYFNEETAEILADEITYLLLHQYVAFNSPVWFNAGLAERYNARGSASGNWAVDRESGRADETTDGYTRPGLSACFIQTVDDNLMDIADGVKREMRVFKSGGGSGMNYSKIRGEGESLTGGGESSGLMSFLEIYDKAAGATKSGGTTRRAARMVVLNADHPDIESFIEWKVREEKKVAALVKAGYSSDFNGEAYRTVSGQNANNSVRVTDDFMRAVENDGDWSTTWRTTKKIAKTMKARALMRKIAEAAHTVACPGMQFDTTCNTWNPTPVSGRINCTNPCSEFSYLDDTACNLASLNLVKFLRDDQEADCEFDVEGYRHAIDVFITAMDIIVDYASYPTKAIAENSHTLRPLGLGYANLGALVMRLGLPYDSNEARALAGVLTSLMTARAYRRSAEIAVAVGPFRAFAFNREPMLNVIRAHASAWALLPDAPSQPLVRVLRDEATAEWEVTHATGQTHGYRNAQATLLAPTGCLVPGSLVLTDQGLTRIEDLGDVSGAKWQDASFKVQTDRGPREATKFYVNGEADVISVSTERGFKIVGTAKHRIKVIDANGAWGWRRFDEIGPDETTPILLGGMFGEPRSVPMPQCPPSYRTNHERGVKTPGFMTSDLAFLVGLFMAEGSLHTKGLRFTLTKADHDLTERAVEVSRELFNVNPSIEDHGECVSVCLNSTQIRAWWQAAGFSKTPRVGGGKGATCSVPDAVLATNSEQVYGAFLNGIFSGDGTVASGLPSVTNKDAAFIADVQTMLLTLGIPFRRDVQVGGLSQKSVYRLTSAGRQFGGVFMNTVGFSAARKRDAVKLVGAFCRGDYIPLPQSLVDMVCPVGHINREEVVRDMRAAGGVHRPLAATLALQSGNEELKRRLGFFYDRIESVELAGRSTTYDISVPDNVTYVANGFVSHNTIGLLMDCDTTGIEPDYALVKYKKLAGRGDMKIVNQSVGPALKRLGYSESDVRDILKYIEEHDTIEGSAVKTEHLPVFDCAARCGSTGKRSIAPKAHVTMMAAAQPFLSGAISKCVTGDTIVATENGLTRIGDLYEGERPDAFREIGLMVDSIGGRKKASSFYYGGVRDVWTVRLADGRSIRGTAPHRLRVATPGGLDWKEIPDLDQGDFVAIKLGSEMWGEAGRVRPRSGVDHGSQKQCLWPEKLDDNLSFLLGALAADGGIARSNWTVTLTKNEPAVLDRAEKILSQSFGLTSRRAIDSRNGVTAQVVSSKTFVEWLDTAGFSKDHVPAGVLGGPRSGVVAWLSGFYLDGYVTKIGDVAISQKRRTVLEDVQILWGNMGVHTYFTDNYHGEDNYPVLHISGGFRRAATQLEWLEPHKAERAADLSDGQDRRVFPMHREALSKLITDSKRTHQFRSVLDQRTTFLRRDTFLATAAEVGLSVSEEERDYTYVPVVSVEMTGQEEVYDLSVPETEAFVANGIMNHNTVNCPAETTVDEVYDLYMMAWKLGLKAIAIYREDSKLCAILSGGAAEKKAEKAEKAAQVNPPATAKAAPVIVDGVVQPTPIRRRLQKRRRGFTQESKVGGQKIYLRTGEYEDGKLGEIFIDMHKEGATMRSLLNSFAIMTSLALQHGVPLEELVDAFVHTKFEPRGIVLHDPNIRTASSILDYVFRTLAITYLDRNDLANVSPETSKTVKPAAVSTSAAPPFNGNGNGYPVDALAALSGVRLTDAARHTLEALLVEKPNMRVTTNSGEPCAACGDITIKAGSCSVCPNCGTTTGCG